MNAPQIRPIIGISLGDINGIGPELIIKTFSDQRISELCTPVIFGSNKVINFYRKSLPDYNLNFNNARELQKLNPKQINIFNC
jgi:4-hydroxythreonine-4-phosphate dehydrogenase